MVNSTKTVTGYDRENALLEDSSAESAQNQISPQKQTKTLENDLDNIYFLLLL